MPEHPSAAEVMDAAVRAMAGPFVWGERDCFTTVSDVLLEVFGVDPLADARGAYRTGEEAWVIVATRGGLDQAMRKAGFRCVTAPRPGDVGMTRFTEKDGLTVESMSVFVGRGWATKTQRGMAVLKTVKQPWRLA